MIAIILSDDGKVFKVFDPKTREDLTDNYCCNAMTVQLNDKRWVTGFHIGADTTQEMMEAVAASCAAGEDALQTAPMGTEDDEDGGRFIGDRRG